MKKKIALAVLVLAILAYTVNYNCNIPSYEYTETPLPGTFEQYYAARLADSRALGARPGNEERLVRYSKGKTPVAILYIHGYGASRAEGEHLLDVIAKDLKANTYYLRLPGHGTNKDDHLKATPRAHLDTAVTALRMMEKLGDKVVVVGTSMGGLITTYLAANYPEKMSGVVLVSPFYNFPTATARLVNHYPIFRAFTALNPVRVSSSPVPPEADNWTNYWYREQYFASGWQLISLARMVARNDVFDKITLPVLMLYYFKDEENQDGSASVSHMKEAFERFGHATKANPQNRIVQVKDGAHVLLSKWERTDRDLVVREIRDFVKRITAAQAK
ncbi:MAG TPA: alpha/beta fold hydrolase [Spirochaetota bacterium]|nr:alpha/beta fold hydrolase [Spirochaetota bacterium]